MYGLTNFLSVLWYSALGLFGLGRSEGHAVTLFDGDPRTGAPEEGRERGLVMDRFDLDSPMAFDGRGAVNNPGPFTSAAEAIANGGAGVRIGSNLYV